MSDQVNSNRQVKRNFFVVKGICERINSLLDQGYLVLDGKGEALDPRWRFQFKEPPWGDLRDHCWCDEVTKRCSDTFTIGYFDPDEPIKEVRAYWSEWRACPKDALVKIL